MSPARLSRGKVPKEMLDLDRSLVTQQLSRVKITALSPASKWPCTISETQFPHLNSYLKMLLVGLNKINYVKVLSTM